MSDKNDKKDVGTTGHSWDGIEELNNPLPRWWVWVLYATIVWGVLYTIAYPAWPLIKGATPGILGFSTRGQVAEDIAAVDAANAELTTKLAAADLATLSDDPELYSYAVNGGRAIFAANCSQCHGSGAAGVQAGGYPNLLDDDWLWGGQVEEIAYTITHGIRNEQSFDSRYSQMTAFGTDEILNEDEINAVVEHVLAISGQEHDAAMASTGAELFYDNCAACHGDNGEGMVDQGAPNLSDAIWLYGGDRETIYESVYFARFGVMPAWSEEYRVGGGLDQSEINAVATYVHQLGGGQ
ncbi:MAG: cytochrome-c oxidase, cbb3-type subunit III [Octadecabacter sp.]|nr:cytochrome-c oxidase, cbb3-type subunit III [Octadecabacter sp.]